MLQNKQLIEELINSSEETKAKIEAEWDEQTTTQDKKERWEQFKAAQNHNERKH